MTAIMLIGFAVLVLWGFVRALSFAARGEVPLLRSEADYAMVIAEKREMFGQPEDAQRCREIAAGKYFRARHLEAWLDRVDRWTWPRRWPR